jgi:hypothetical protein
MFLSIIATTTTTQSTPMIFIPLGFLIFVSIIVLLIKGLRKPTKKNQRPNTKGQKQTKSNNCNGCQRQNECEYGYYTYDTIDGRQWSLWEKYMRASNVVFDKRTPEQSEYANRLSKQRKFSSVDVLWLTEYLKLEQADYNKIRQFGKCGLAYARYMRLKGLLENIEFNLKKAKEAAQ